MAKKEQPKPSQSSFTFVENDFIDLPGLTSRLKKAEDPVSAYLQGRFQPETRTSLEKFDGSERTAKGLRQALVDELSQVVQDSAFYDAKRFAQADLGEETRRLAESSPQGNDLTRLNVLLLEDTYQQELLRNFSRQPKVAVERIQTGVRMEKRMVKVLKAMAEYSDVTMGELLEDIVLHAFAGHSTFYGPQSQRRIASLKEVYGLDYDPHTAYQFEESTDKA